MANAISSPPHAAGIPAQIAHRLRSLRRSIGAWLWIDGLSRVLAWLVGLALVDLALDWYFRMDWHQRAVSLALIGALLATVVFRRLIRPLSRKLDDDTLCLRVEDRHRQLGERLISAVQFSRLADFDQLGVSPRFVQVTIADGTQAATAVDFQQVLDAPTMRRNVAILVLALVGIVAIGASAALTEPIGIWFNRNVLLGSREWPQETYLLIQGVEDGSLAMPRGDDWDQVVDVTGIVPPIIQLDYRPKSWSARSTEQMAQQGERSFHMLFKNVLEEFDFRVRGGDAQSPWISVRLIERPAVSELELKLIPPAYVGTGPEELAAGKGPYDALKGSTLVISGKASKDLASASIAIGEQSGSAATIVDSTSFSARIEPSQLAGQTYSINLVDTSGWESKRPTRFTIKIKPDRDPVVKAKLSGISGMIVPGARIPIAGTLSDDYAVTDASLVHQWRSEGTDQTTVDGRLPLVEIKDQFGTSRIAYRYLFETEPLNLPIGSALAFHLEAVDNDTVSGPKIGKSEETVLKVVSEEDLRADLLRREKEQRIEVERLLKDQEDLLTDSRAILATIEDKPEVPDDQRQLLIKTQKRQHLTSERANSVAGQLTQIIAEVRNNRLEEEQGELQSRLQRQIIEPLESLATESIPKAAALLDAARRAGSDVEVRDKALADAAAEQQRIAVRLREVLKFMAKAEGYQEAVNLLYAILKSQTELHEGTVKEAQRRIGELFGREHEQDKPAGAPPDSTKKGETP